MLSKAEQECVVAQTSNRRELGVRAMSYVTQRWRGVGVAHCVHIWRLHLGAKTACDAERARASRALSDAVGAQRAELQTAAQDAKQLQQQLDRAHADVAALTSVIATLSCNPFLSRLERMHRRRHTVRRPSY